MHSSVTFMRGDTDALSSSLEQILSHTASFEDGLSASALLAKLLASQFKYKECISNCLDILSSLGEEFPAEVTHSVVMGVLSAMKPIMSELTVERVKQLPRMSDGTKRRAMQFLGMLCTFCNIANPLLLPLLSCRMLTLTMEYGFCDDSIIGIIMAAHGVVSLTTFFAFSPSLHQPCLTNLFIHLNSSGLQTI